jgi:protein-disulfide isomerase
LPRLSLLLVALIAVLGFGVAYIAVRPMPDGMTEQQVRSIVNEAMAAEPAAMTDDAVRALISAALTERGAGALQSRSTIDPETLNPMIEDYLLSNPRILQRVSAALEEEIRVAQAEQSRAAIAAMRVQIFEDPDHVVLGNPEGDVTLVEMFDYNCGYCRQALPDLATLIAEDPNLKVILKEFPILGPDSVAAARVGVLVAQADADYWQFHQALFTSRGAITGDTALAAAAQMGLSRVSLELEMAAPKVTAVLDRSYEIARALGISGTPTFIIGDEVIPGAIGLDGLRGRVANMRACGETICDSRETAAAADAADQG